LYLYLLLAVNHGTGRRLLSPAAIAREMGVSEPTVRSWLGHLRKAGYLTTERQGSLVRVGITKWQETIQRSETPQGARKPAASAASPLTAETLAKKLGCRPDEPFLKDTVTKEDPGRIQGVLDKVLEVPESRIKKSRLALFRYLISNPPRA
jgi:DNA-binding transcriptional ArsR family regulator